MNLSTLPSSEGVYVGSKIDYHAEGYTRLEPRPRTHDIALSSRHIPNIERLAQDLSTAVKSAWSENRGNRYSMVNVLLTGWKDDDLNVGTEIEDLGFLFKDQYGYNVEKYQIPSLKPDRALKDRVLSFLKEGDKKDSLLIFYYAGHARRSPQSNGAPIWVANREPASATLPSSGIQSLLEEADADVLFLYDCCHSAALPTSDTQSQDSGGVKEVLAACGFESIAPGVDKHSFTKALIETLALASRKLTFSIPELHSRVLSRIMGWTPGLMKDEDGKFVKITEGPGRGRLALEREPRTTPIYSMLSTTKSRRSIILSPVLPSNPQSGTSKNGNANSNSSSAASTDPIGLNMPPKKRKRHNSKQAKYPQILVSIRLENDTIDQQAWLDYFRLMPPEAKDIKIEGVYQSFSTLVLLRLPIVVWDLLPDNAAYTFVGFVTSENTVSTISQPEGTAEEQSEVDKKKLDEEVSGDSVSSKKAESQWRMSKDVEARTAKESTTIGRATESPPLRETSTSDNVTVDPSLFVRSPRKAEKEVRGRPLNLPRLLETICDSGLRKLVRTICERHPNIAAEIIASAPRPSPAATIEVLKKYQERLLEAFPYGGRPGSDYAYNRVKQPLIQLTDSITDFIPEFLPPNETRGGVSLIILDNATKIICELPEWDSSSHRHHKDNICEEISMAWTLVITEESKKGAEFEFLSEGWDIILRKHNERLEGRLQSAVNALERMSLLGISNGSNSTPPKGTNFSPESDPEVEALRNQLQSGSLGN